MQFLPDIANLQNDLLVLLLTYKYFRSRNKYCMAIKYTNFNFSNRIKEIFKRLSYFWVNLRLL